MSPVHKRTPPTLRLLRAVVDELSTPMYSKGAGACTEVGAARLLMTIDNAVERKREKRIFAVGVVEVCRRSVC